MPVPDLLLGTRRLRGEISAQSQQLERDIERVKFTTVQLRRTAVARMTSPLGLLSAMAAGFITGKIGGRRSPPKRIAKRATASIAALALSTARSVGMQVVLPMAMQWVQAKFTDKSSAESTSSQSTSPPA